MIWKKKKNIIYVLVSCMIFMNITAPRVDKTDSKHLLCLGFKFTGLLNSACFEKTHQLTKKFVLQSVLNTSFFIYSLLFASYYCSNTLWNSNATLTLNILIYVKKNKFLIVWNMWYSMRGWTWNLEVGHCPRFANNRIINISKCILLFFTSG